MNPVEACWEGMRDELQAKVAGHPDVVCRIPSWQPVDLAMGLRWLQSNIYEGFSVAYHVTETEGRTTVGFKRWEYGESEPPWTDG